MMKFQMRLAIIFLALVSTTKAFADLESDYMTDILCRDAVIAQLKSTGTTREWSQLSARELDGSRRFFSPTNVIGVWTEARVFLNKEVELRRITANFTEVRSFDLTTCKLKAVAQKQRLFFSSPRAGETVFTDRDLRNLLAQHDRGLIYIWSPHMPYSYRALNERASGVDSIREVARKLGLNLTVVVDPAANQLFTQKLASENRSLRLSAASPTHRAQSLELSFRAMNTHFPVLITYSKGKIARHAYPGVGTETEYSKIVTKQLAELAR